MFRRRATLLPSFLSCLILAMMLTSAQPASAQGFEGSAFEEGFAKGLDAVLIRPLAAARVVVGAAFLVPASAFAIIGGLDPVRAAYEVLVDEPVEFAFKRDLGDF